MGSRHCARTCNSEACQFVKVDLEREYGKNETETEIENLNDDSVELVEDELINYIFDVINGQEDNQPLEIEALMTDENGDNLKLPINILVEPISPSSPGVEELPKSFDDDFEVEPEVGEVESPGPEAFSGVESGFDRSGELDEIQESGEKIREEIRAKG